MALCFNVTKRHVSRVCLKYFERRLTLACSNRVRLRQTCAVIDVSRNPPLLSHQALNVSTRTIAHNVKYEDKSSELSMEDPIFNEYVKYLVENKALVPRYHAMLTAKLSDYDLRVADMFELSVVLDEDGEVDDEFRQLARSDLNGIEEAKRQIDRDIVDIVLIAVKEEEEDDSGIDKTSTTMEFEGGAGGQESMIFNGEIFEMYRNLANYRGWVFDVTEYEGETSTAGGSFALARAAADVKGDGAYHLLKFEAGVHRVQRVPVTGKRSGQLHTSTCVVIVTPTVTNPRIELKPQDLKITYTKSSGPGGQAVNTANSAVRIVHLATGLVVECQEERSAHFNQEVALNRLREKLFLREREQILESNQRQRRVQIGTRDRSEKIRTYNFQQGRVTDHRIGVTVGSPEVLMRGGAELEELIEGVSGAHLKEVLVERLKQFAKEKGIRS